MKVAVVTGASAGVGRAVVRRFAREGFDVGLIAREPRRLEAASIEAERFGVRALAVSADVADARAVDDAASVFEEGLGPIDVWVNNAMTSVLSAIKDMPAEEFRRVTDVTYLGYVNGTKAALGRMLPRDRGTIVQVGSALAHRAIPLQSAYCAAKHAIKGFTESLRCELLHDGSGVRATMVNLPALNTPQFEWIRTRMGGHPRPVAPVYQPEIAAEAILWAASHPRRQLNVGAVTTATIIAAKLFPGLLDRYLARTGYESQQMQRPPEPGREDDLWEPLDLDVAAHGEFDDEAASRSPHLWLNTHRFTVAAIGAAGAIAWRAASRSR